MYEKRRVEQEKNNVVSNSLHHTTNIIKPDKDCSKQEVVKF